jgi:hypothetical protein
MKKGQKQYRKECNFVLKLQKKRICIPDVFRGYIFFPWISLLRVRRNTRVDTPITEHSPVTDRAICSELGRSLPLYYTCQCTYCIV